MVIDCHVHVCAFTPEHGRTSPHLLSTIPFRFMRWRLGLRGEHRQTEIDLENTLLALIRATPQLDKVVVLAFDAVHDRDGQLALANTHLYVTNDYALELCRRNAATMLFGASIHPYRKDAVAE